MDEMIYKPLIQDMTWSYSRISCFDDCPYRWYLNYISKSEKEPMFYSSYGSFMHSLIEQYYNKSLSPSELKIKFLTEFKDKVKGDLPPKDGVSKFINAGISYFENMKDFPCKPVEVERRTYFEYGGKKFVGVIDFLGEADGEYWIIDNKSKDLKPRSKRARKTLNDGVLDEMLKQLYLYSTIVKSRFHKFPKYLCFNCFKNQQFIVEEFNEETYYEVMDEILKKIEKIENTNDFHPYIDFFSCRYICDVHSDCIYYD